MIQSYNSTKPVKLVSWTGIVPVKFFPDRSLLQIRKMISRKGINLGFSKKKKNIIFVMSHCFG
jgi:hypothetical protein